jgi:GAF domain-containing protein
MRVELVERLLSLTWTTAPEFDPVTFAGELAEHAAAVSGCDAGALLAFPRPPVQIAAATAGASALMRRQLDSGDGPGLACFQGSGIVTMLDVRGGHSRWPEFAAAASGAGFASVHALPVEMESETLGALCLFSPKPGSLDHETRQLVQALAQAAAIGVVHRRAAQNADQLTRQLRSALDSRVAIEQAKGIIAERHHISPDEAFHLLRRYARDHNQQLTDLSGTVTRSTRSAAASGVTAPNPPG